jgi:hypothetical protein
MVMLAVLAEVVLVDIEHLLEHLVVELVQKQN